MAGASDSSNVIAHVAFSSHHDATPRLAPRRREPERRPPAVLQVLPRLVTGGVERGTVEIAAALVAARLAARSSPRPAGRWCARSSAPARTHVDAAARSEESAGDARQRRAPGRRSSRATTSTSSMRAAARRPGARAPRRGAPGAHFVTTFHNAYGARTRAEAALQLGDGARASASSPSRSSSRARRRDLRRRRASACASCRAASTSQRFDPERISAERMIALARAMAPAGRRAGGDAAGTADALEGAARADRGAARGSAARDAPLPARRRRHASAIAASSRRRSRAIAPAGAGCSIVDDCRDMPAAYMLADVVVSASTEPEGLRPRHRRGAGDGPAGDRDRPRRRARDGACRARPAGWCRPATRRARRRARPRRSISRREARLALAERAIEHVAPNFTRRAHDRAHHRDLRGGAASRRGGDPGSARGLGMTVPA